jgi:hypothetical protein
MFTNRNHLKRQSQIGARNKIGSAIADAPGAIWCLFMALLFPAMCYASLFYRATLMYFATRDSCYKAAKSSTYSNAVSAGNAAFGTDVAAFTGMSGSIVFYIVTQPTNGAAAPNPSSTALGTVNQTNNIYFIKAVTTATIQPLFSVGPGWLGESIPGLTGPYPLTVTAEYYVENPTGLTN